MGFTPLDGIVMGTRSGSIDPAIVLYLINELKYSTEDVNTLLNKKSGVLGISGVSSDFRDIEDAAAKGDERAILALDIYHYRIRTQIGAYAAAMGGVDAIVFTAGVKVDKEKDNVRGKVREISTEDSTVKAFVIPTNEELVIARDTKNLVK